MFPAPGVTQEVSPEVSRRAVSKSSGERYGVVTGLRGILPKDAQLVILSISKFHTFKLTHISFLFCSVVLAAVSKHRTRRKARKGGCVAHTLRIQSFMGGGEAGWWEHEAVGHTALTGREQRDEYGWPGGFSFSPGPQSKQCHPHSGPTAPSSPVAFLELS